MPNLPPTFYGPNHDGVLDPDKPSPANRRNASQTRLNAEQAGRTSRSPAMRALQAAADRALGWSTR